MTVSVLHIPSMCQKIQEIPKLLIILLEVKVDYPDYSLRGRIRPLLLKSKAS